MSKKLNEEQIAVLKTHGISGNTEEGVRKAVIEKLAANDVTEVDEDPIADLIEMLSAFEVLEGVGKEASESDEELEELADEVEEMPKKEKASTKLKGETVTKTAPVKKVKEPAAAKAKETKFDADSEEYQALIAKFKKAIPEKDYQYDFISAGFTIRKKGANSTNRSIFTFFNARLIDGKFVGIGAFAGYRLYSDGVERFKAKIKDDEELLEKFVVEGNTMPRLKFVDANVCLDLLIEGGCLEEMTTKMVKLEDKLTKNREKLEEQVEKASKTSKKK